MHQQILEFAFQTHFSFAFFHPGGNEELCTQLQNFAVDGAEQQIYIWGEAGAGKTHLLHACCQLAKKSGREPFYLNITPDMPLDVGLLTGLEEWDVVCLDNIQHLAGQTAWQQALFAFYNAQRLNNRQLLVSADCPPKYLPFSLLDLKTRMGWGLTLKIQPLDDDNLIAALRLKANSLGFELPPKVARYLLAHYVRDLPDLWRLLDQIDQATLAEQHKLTIPFLKKIFKKEDMSQLTQKTSSF
jgi:DnaA-homolog protein